MSNFTSTFKYTAIFHLSSSCFRIDNNPSLCGNNTCNQTQNKKKNKKKLIQIGIPVLAAALLIVAVVVCILWARRNNRPGNIVDNHKQRLC
jgi:hypothetical protein